MQSYFINDPSTPELMDTFDLPLQDNSMMFTIDGFAGECNDVGTVGFQAANVFITLNHALAYFRSQFIEGGRSLNSWVGTNNLLIHPRAGEKFNAYYSRGSINYMYGQDTNLNKTVYTADSADIVAHELGHAVLDAGKPELFNLASCEVWAFHEAFADICAISSIMSYDKAVFKALSETNQTLKGSNTLSRLAEQVGQACRHKNYLRDLENDFSYVNPSTLPQAANEDGLSSEVHSFSRIFSSAWYDIFTSIFEFEKANLSPREAVRSARDKCFKWLIRGVMSAPKTPKFFEAVSRGMCMASKSDKSPYNEIISTIFAQRKLTPSLLMLSEPKKINSDFEKTLESEWGLLVKKENNRIIKLSDHFDGTLTLSADNPFMSAELEIAADEYAELDTDGNVVAMMSLSEEDILKQAKMAAFAMNQNKEIWSIQDGKAVRNMI